VVEALLEGDRASTKQALSAITGLTGRPRTLVVLERDDALTWLSLRNVDTVHIVAVDQLNTYDVLRSDDVVFTKGAYDAFVSAGTRGSEQAGTRGSEQAGTDTGVEASQA
jgi:large subunit ribosomal protein L4